MGVTSPGGVRGHRVGSAPSSRPWVARCAGERVPSPLPRPPPASGSPQRPGSVASGRVPRSAVGWRGVGAGPATAGIPPAQAHPAGLGASALPAGPPVTGARGCGSVPAPQGHPTVGTCPLFLPTRRARSLLGGPPGRPPGQIWPRTGRQRFLGFQAGVGRSGEPRARPGSPAWPSPRLLSPAFRCVSLTIRNTRPVFRGCCSRRPGLGGVPSDNPRCLT